MANYDEKKGEYRLSLTDMHEAILYVQDIKQDLRQTLRHLERAVNVFVKTDEELCKYLRKSFSDYLDGSELGVYNEHIVPLINYFNKRGKDTPQVTETVAIFFMTLIYLVLEKDNNFYYNPKKKEGVLDISVEELRDDIMFKMIESMPPYVAIVIEIHKNYIKSKLEDARDFTADANERKSYQLAQEKYAQIEHEIENKFCSEFGASINEATSDNDGEPSDGDAIKEGTLALDYSGHVLVNLMSALNKVPIAKQDVSWAMLYEDIEKLGELLTLLPFEKGKQVLRKLRKDVKKRLVETEKIIASLEDMLTNPENYSEAELRNLSEYKLNKIDYKYKEEYDKAKTSPTEIVDSSK